MNMLSYVDMYNLPKGYLSYSSMNLWKSSKDQFRKKYYSTVPYDLDTPYTRFGKETAETLENKKDTKAHPVLSQIPMYSTREFTFEHEVEGIMVKGAIDSFDKRHKRIIEIKTGIRKDGEKAPWDRVKVKKHNQLTLYSLMVKELFGTVHPEVKLIWLETAWVEVCKEIPFGDKTFNSCSPELAFTGNYTIFPRIIEDWEHDYMRGFIVECATEISEDYTRYKALSTP